MRMNQNSVVRPGLAVGASAHHEVAISQEPIRRFSSAQLPPLEIVQDVLLVGRQVWGAIAQIGI